MDLKKNTHILSLKSSGGVFSVGCFLNVLRSGQVGLQVLVSVVETHDHVVLGERLGEKTAEVTVCQSPQDPSPRQGTPVRQRTGFCLTGEKDHTGLDQGWAVQPEVKGATIGIFRKRLNKQVEEGREGKGQSLPPVFNADQPSLQLAELSHTQETCSQ